MTNGSFALPMLVASLSHTFAVYRRRVHCVRGLTRSISWPVEEHVQVRRISLGEGKLLREVLELTRQVTVPPRAHFQQT